MSLDPRTVVASFDSASVLHASTVAALNRRDFPHLGNAAVLGAAVRVAGRLPWPILREIYARIGGAEGLKPAQLGQVDMAEVAASFANAYPERAYPGAMIGSSNGAMTHLAAAMQVPWLPGTVLVPVRRVADPQRPDLALEFGKRVAPALLAANPEIVVHQMHDPAQDELMVARMSYFRTKWRVVPKAYLDFLSTRLEPRAPVFLIDDESRWPVVRVGDRHVFQTGGRGGLSSQDYLERPHTPSPDDEAAEAEWGAEPDFTAGIRAWCRRHGHPCVRILVDGPQEASHPVAELMRSWTRGRGGSGDELIVPSFVLGDPWRTITMGRVPFWTFFPVESAFDSLRYHLEHSDPYRSVHVLLFQHGALSPGIATPDAIEAMIREHDTVPRFVALRRTKSPRDIGSMGRYGPALHREDAQLPFARLDAAEVAHALTRIIGERGRPIAVIDPIDRAAVDAADQEAAE